MGIAAFIVTAPFAKPLRIQTSALSQKAHIGIGSNPSQKSGG